MIRPFLCSRICVNTLFQLGLPAIVRDFRPVTRSRFSCNVQVLSIILLDNTVCRADKPEKNLIPGSRVASSVYLFVEEVQCQLQPDCFHVSLLQCRSDVHVHVEKMPHDSVLFRLLDFQLREQFDEPFERLLVTIYPEEVHLLSKERKK